MGTNYYVATNICECCNRRDEMHIGKQSWGWAFSFRGYRSEYDEAPIIESWRDWKAYLRDKQIVDEYGDPVNYDVFVDLVEGIGSPSYTNPENGHKNLSHNEAGKKDKYPWFNPDHDWDDEFGYSFSDREFS